MVLVGLVSIYRGASSWVSRALACTSIRAFAHTRRTLETCSLSIDKESGFHVLVSCCLCEQVCLIWPVIYVLIYVHAAFNFLWSSEAKLHFCNPNFGVVENADLAFAFFLSHTFTSHTYRLIRKTLFGFVLCTGFGFLIADAVVSANSFGHAFPALYSAY